MLSTVFGPPLLHGITWSKCSSLFEPHWRHRPPSLTATSIFTSCGMARVLRSPDGAALRDIWTSSSSTTGVCRSTSR